MAVGSHRSEFARALREWRRRGRVSQLELALDAETTQRHVSFIESDRSVPGRQMVVRLAEALDVPLRERNSLLLAAGYAPAYDESDLDDPEARPDPQRARAGARRAPPLSGDDRRSTWRPRLRQRGILGADRGCCAGAPQAAHQHRPRDPRPAGSRRGSPTSTSTPGT